MKVSVIVTFALGLVYTSSRVNCLPRMTVIFNIGIYTHHWQFSTLCHKKLSHSVHAILEFCCLPKCFFF